MFRMNDQRCAIEIRLLYMSNTTPYVALRINDAAAAVFACIHKYRTPSKIGSISSESNWYTPSIRPLRDSRLTPHRAMNLTCIVYATCQLSFSDTERCVDANGANCTTRADTLPSRYGFHSYDFPLNTWPL
jgi:hypothetical protein